MYEFNPFDDLGINPDSNNRLNETWRDRSYSEKLGGSFNDSQSIPTDSQPEYQPDFDTPLVDVSNPKDYQVISELGIIAPNKMNEEEKQNYVDNLSDEDWKIWNQLKDEGYSFEVRKAMFDNRDDLYDIAEPGNKKFWSANKSETMQTALDLIQDAVDYQEDTVHPWSQSKQEYLDLVANELYSDTFENIYQDKYQDYLNTDNRLLRRVKSASMLPVSVVQRGATIAGGMLVDLAKDSVGLIDHIGNIGVQLFAAGGNKIAGYDKGYDLVQIDPESPNILGSYVKGVKDFLGAGFTIAYPFATWLLTTIGTESENVQRLMNATHGGIKRFAKEIFETIGLEHFNLDSLSEEELEAFYDDIATGVFIIFADLTGKGINWLGKRQAIKDFLFIKNIAQETSEIGRQEIINQVKETGKTMEKEPVGTKFRTEGGTKMAEVTPNGVRTTPYGKLRILQKVLGGRVNGWIRGFQRALEEVMNKDKLVTRDPNAPVGELPVPDVKIREEEVKNPGEGEIKEGEIKEPTVEEKPTEVKNPKDEIKTPGGGTKTDIKDSTLKTEPTGNSGIGDFIKKTINKLTGKQGGMDKDLFEKFSSSPDLQNEYINTIDPYLKANGAENPAGVIENQLNDFVETVKEQLEDRRNNNIEFQKGQMKYKVQIPESDKIKRNQENTEIKNLIRTLSKQSADPEKFLNYLLNLPEEKVQALNKFIPNFSNNLALIKDTLDLTKAITSSDLLGKFLQYKSTWGTRRKNFIRRYLWKKINEAYKKAGIKRNMYEIENILNKMSEEELVQLENEIDNGGIRPYMSDAEFADLLDKGYTPGTWIPANQNIKEIMDSKRPGTNKTTREYLKEKGVQISLTDERGLQKIGGNIQAAYSAKLDRILMKSENNPYKGIVYHEFGHRVLAQLGTTQIMDIITHIAKRDGITQDAAFERRAEYFRNYLQYNNVDGKKYLIKNLGDDIASKINATMEKTKEEIWDLFDLNEGDKNINQILSDVKHDTPRGKDITSRRPEPLIKEMVPESSPVRYEYLRTIDPNIESVEIYPYFDKPIQIRFKDGSTQRWTEYRKTLTPEQLKEIDTYETDIVREFVDEQTGRDKGFKGEGKFDYDTLQNENDLTSLLMDETFKSFKQTKESLGLDAFETVSYLKSLQNIDPDILGLVEKDGQLYVKYKMESQRERYELPDRPGYVEVKEVPAKDYFTEEELNQLPKDLVDKIKKDAN